LKRFEVKNIITYWKQPEQSNEKIAWLLYDEQDQTHTGYSFEEAWELIYQYGAVNAAAITITTKSLKIKEISFSNHLPSFTSTSWQLNYEKAQELSYSHSCIEKINILKLADVKWKIHVKREDWKRKNKDLITNWRTHQKVLQCIKLAHSIKESAHPVIYIGASIWDETGLPSIYPQDNGKHTPLEEECYLQSIQEALKSLEVEIDYHENRFLPFPYVFEFLHVVKKLNKNVQLLFENKNHSFERIDSNPDLIIGIGSIVPDNVKNAESIYYIGHEKPDQKDRYKAVLQGPITLILKEIEGHFVLKGRGLCNVCSQKVASGVGSSKIAPVTIAICYSCASKGAEPYGVVVTRVAIGKERKQDYRPGPYLSFVIDSTLSLLGKSREEFNQDVDEQVEKMRHRKLAAQRGSIS
jgi:hypothetical protein